MNTDSENENSSQQNDDFSKSIPLEKRSLLNHTHSNVIDDCIEEIRTYSIKPNKFIILLIGYIFTIGILYIIRLFFPIVLIVVACEEDDPKKAHYVKITENNGKQTIIPIEHINIFSKNKFFNNKKVPSLSKTKLMQDHYIGVEKDNLEEFDQVFKFKNNKYIYSEKAKKFFPLVFELNNLKNNEVIQYYKTEKIDINNYHYQLNKFGLNHVIKIKSTTFNIIIKRLFTVGNIYNFFCSIILALNKSWFLCSFVLLVTIAELIIEILFEKRYSFNIFKVEVSKEIEVSRNFEPEVLSTKDLILNNKNPNKKIKSSEYFINESNDEVDDFDFSESNFYKSQFLVPGDVILVGDGCVLPCDGLILDGSCTVDETDLNGENRLKIKFSIPHDSTPFSFVSNKKSILFQGTKIDKCQSTDKKISKITVLVVNTGLNTYRSALIQNYKDNKPGNFRFFFDYSNTILILILIWLVSSFYTLIDSKPVTIETLKSILLNMTVIISPFLSICFHFCCIFFHFKLQKRKIKCISNQKLITSGRIDTIIIDKAGTLADEELELYGFQTLKNGINFGKIIKDEKYFKDIFFSFWNDQLNKNFDLENKKIIDTRYQEDEAYAPIYFSECLACCNSVNKVRDDKISGNDIDILIYNSFKWDFEIDESNGTKISVFPKNSYKIIDNTITFNSTPYKLEYIKRYQFSPQTQTQSVIVKNSLDNSYRIYIKGATEKIFDYCNEDTTPSNYDDLVRCHTQEGYRLIACATKLINEEDLEEIIEKDDFSKYKYEMNFLGFVIFKNSPKNDTHNIISGLVNAGIKVILATEENPYSARRIALDCGIITQNEKMFLIDYNKDELTQSYKFQIDLKKNDEDEEEEDNDFDLESISATVRNQQRGNVMIAETNNSNEPSSNSIYNRHVGNTIFDINFVNSLGKKRTGLSHFVEKKEAEEITKEDIDKILSEPNSVLCLNGLALLKLNQYMHNIEQLYKNNEKEKLDLLELVKTKGIIFYRLNQNDKKVLINLLESDKRSIIAMCGEASVEGSSLMASDVSISLNQMENNINLLSNFSYSGSSLSCIRNLMKIGRACYENNLILVKYIILISVTRLVMQLKFLEHDVKINNIQNLFLNVFCVFIPVSISAATGANYNLSKEMTPFSLFNKKFFFSLFGQFFILVGSQLCFILYLPYFCNLDEKSDLRFQSCLFMVNVFQYLSLLVVFNIHSSHRKKIYVNKLFMFYFPLLALYSSCLITVKEFREYFLGDQLVNFNEDEDRLEEENELAKIITLLSSTIIFVLSYIYEFIIWKFM